MRQHVAWRLRQPGEEGVERGNGAGGENLPSTTTLARPSLFGLASSSLRCRMSAVTDRCSARVPSEFPTASRGASCGEPEPLLFGVPSFGVREPLFGVPIGVDPSMDMTSASLSDFAVHSSKPSMDLGRAPGLALFGVHSPDCDCDGLSRPVGVPTGLELPMVAVLTSDGRLSCLFCPSMDPRIFRSPLVAVFPGCCS